MTRQWNLSIRTEETGIDVKLFYQKLLSPNIGNLG